MSKLKRPLRLWHGLLSRSSRRWRVGAAGTAIAGGGQSKSLGTAGFGPGGFLDSGKYHYGAKARGTPLGDSQENVR